jgi:Mg-chelatase subunit ChlD
MQPDVTISREDLHNSLWRGVKQPDIERAMLSRLKVPSPDETSVSPLFLLRRCNPELASLVCAWMGGACPGTLAEAPIIKNLLFIPYAQRGLQLKKYLLPLIQKHKPAAVAIDASVSAIGASLTYAGSLLYALHIPVRAGLCRGDECFEELFFEPGDFLPELASLCFRTKLPLVPLLVKTRLVPSQYQLAYKELLTAANNHFAEEIKTRIDIATLAKRAEQHMNSVFTAGLDLYLERENAIIESCYAASRLYDLSCYQRFKAGSRATILVLYSLPHSLDFPSLVKTFSSKKAALSELYRDPEPEMDGCLRMAPLDACERSDTSHEDSGFIKELGKTLDDVLNRRMQDKLSHADIDRLASAVATATRHHPLIARPGGVRGTLAIREIAQAFGVLRGAVTRKTLAEAALIALSHRNHIKPGEDTSVEQILKSIISREVYSIPLYPTEEEFAPAKPRPLTPEELAKALAGLTDAAFRELGPGEALPLDNPEFAEAALNHPLVQQALKDALEKGLLNNLRQSYRDLLKELEERGLIDLLNSSAMTLTQDGQQALKKSLEEALARGEISPEDLIKYLNNSKAMPKPPGVKGDKMSLSPQGLTEMLAELMDFQHQGRSETSSLEDLYVHYTLNDKKGMEVSAEKLDYEKLKILIHDLEKKGMISLSEGRKRFSLSCNALEKLLEGLVRRQEGQALERRAFRREHEIDKSDVRRFRTGDVFRDISVRHSLRRIIRKGKALGDINRSDLRAFEKKPSNQLDIAICVDVSASMKEHAKLRYAKMAVAELARAAIDKQDRIGVVAFSNLGQIVVPLTDKLTRILEAAMTMKAEQYTNIGNGLICARRMLLKEKNSNPKYVILITDGQPNAALIEDQDSASRHTRVATFSRETSMERKEHIGTQHALNEAAKTSRENIKISVVFISQGEGQGERLAREVARIGRGRFHKVHAVERLPLEALVTVA